MSDYDPDYSMLCLRVLGDPACCMNLCCKLTWVLVCCSGIWGSVFPFLCHPWPRFGTGRPPGAHLCVVRGGGAGGGGEPPARGHAAGWGERRLHFSTSLFAVVLPLDLKPKLKPGIRQVTSRQKPASVLSLLHRNHMYVCVYRYICTRLCVCKYETLRVQICTWDCVCIRMLCETLYVGIHNRLYI